LKKIPLIPVAIITAILTLSAAENSVAQESPRAAMKSNSQVVYNDYPGEVDGLFEMFSEGKFYGRLRSNTFYFWWKGEDTVENDVHLISGLGGSLVYKSAALNGFDFGGALYYSYAFFHNKEDHLSGWKAGKDAVSRHDLANTGDKSMSVLGQAYLRYKPSQQSEIIAGRQLVETFYTKSNDTKMIPNTFDGIVASSKDIPDTKLTLAYLAKQKLRDHTQNHSVLVYGDVNSSSSAKSGWSENDDGAMHRGLSYTAIKTAGKSTNAPLITGDFRNRSIENLTVDASFYVVPEMLSQTMGEVNYKVNFGEVSVTPGLRYIKQFDNGAGAVGGASLNGEVNVLNPAGYKTPDSLESQMIAARVDKSRLQLYFG